MSFFKNLKISFFAKKFTVKNNTVPKNKIAEIRVNSLTKKMFDIQRKNEKSFFGQKTGTIELIYSGKKIFFQKIRYISIKFLKK